MRLDVDQNNADFVRELHEHLSDSPELNQLEKDLLVDSSKNHEDSDWQALLFQGLEHLNKEPNQKDEFKDFFLGLDIGGDDNSLSQDKEIDEKK